MTKFSKLAGRFAIVAGVCLVVSFLPVVPVLTAPVIPHPDYHSTVVSIQRLFLSPWMMGADFRATWGTILVLLVLMAMAVIGGLRLGRLVVGRV